MGILRARRDRHCHSVLGVSANRAAWLLRGNGRAPLAGRLLEDTDLPAGESIVINAAAAEQYFGGNAVGHTIRSTEKIPHYWRVASVVPNIRHSGPGGRVGPEMYVLPDPRGTDTSPITLAMVMRLRAGASLPADRLKQIAEDLGPRVLVERVRPAAALISQQVAKPRDRALLLTLLGAFGLLLTLVGIFSMTAYAIARRTREIGVRVAFGAQRAQVVGGMLRDVACPLPLAWPQVSSAHTTRRV